MAERGRDRFEALIEKHRAIVLKTVHTYCRKPEDREDLQQEIVAQLWRAWPKYDTSRSFTTWMYRIALNVAITYVRGAVRQLRVFAPMENDIAEVELPLPTDGSEERAERLRQFIEREPPLERALLLLYLEEKPQKEIADILGISATNVSTKISRLKQRIRREI